MIIIPSILLTLFICFLIFLLLKKRNKYNQETKILLQKVINSAAELNTITLDYFGRNNLPKGMKQYLVFDCLAFSSELVLSLYHHFSLTTDNPKEDVRKEVLKSMKKIAFRSMINMKKPVTRKRAHEVAEEIQNKAMLILETFNSPENKTMGFQERENILVEYFANRMGIENPLYKESIRWYVRDTVTGVKTPDAVKHLYYS